MRQNSSRKIAGFENFVSLMPPSVLALIVQIFSLIPTSAIAIFSELYLDYSFPILIYVVCQAVFSACFSFLFRMDWWWHPIQFFFPILVILFVSAKIPSNYYFFAFILFVLIYWSSFRTRVPYFPSRPSLTPAVLDLFPKEKSINFIDVGSGMGGLVIELSKVNEKSRFSGVEIAPFLWLVSYLRGKFLKSRVRFLLGDYGKIDFSEYDVVFAYLSPAAMPELWLKAKREMRPGTILLSYEFVIADIKPDLCINSDLNDPTLYVWRI